MIKFEGVFESENHYFLVMEILNGGNLLEYLSSQKSALKIDQIRILMRNLMECLTEFEEMDIVHRDIKL
jgi:serine/threonine protein kinase